MLRFLMIVAATLLLATGAKAQGLAVATSDPTVWIHSTFSGETITLFGNIEPDPSTGDPPRGPFDVVVVVRGPVSERVVRQRTRQFGIMLNTEYALFSALPSFYRVLSSRPLDGLADPEILEERLLTLEAQAQAAAREATGDMEMFKHELVRLMQQANLFWSDPRGVQFLSPTFYAARISLPANVPNGSFLAQTFVFQNGEIVAERAQRFFVQKTGFERFLGEASRNYPLLYGLAAVLLAVFTGWLGGVVFRR